MLRLHLDWPPRDPRSLPFRDAIRYIRHRDVIRKVKFPRLIEFDAAAVKLARILSSSVEVVSLLEPSRALWCAFGVRRKPGEEAYVVELLNNDIEGSYGLS